MTTENLSTLKIHKLTQEQYDREFAAGRIDPSAIYLTPDDATGTADSLIASHNISDDAHSDIRQMIGEKVYTQPDEPADAAVGSLWIDTDEVGNENSVDIETVEVFPTGNTGVWINNYGAYKTEVTNFYLHEPIRITKNM